MSDIAIRVENLSKRYRIGLKEEMRDTLFDAMADFVRQPIKNLRRLRRLSRFEEDGHDSEDIIWALKDVSFEVERGEVVGIIGRNGAGKTTLLKILSHITEPTSGRAEINGRVASLLAVGTGFHSELTGRENVYLNGTILGMKKTEVDRKFDEIVDFSGVEKFIDTPVKRYSSGMYVRLAFAVAAHLEPEILLVDEVLAVGDAAFQKKCLGKMGEVATEGKTVLFVSHNMAAISRLCQWCVWLDEGRVRAIQPAGQAIQQYLSAGISESASVVFAEDPSKDAQYLSVQILNEEGMEASELSCDEAVTLRLVYRIRKSIPGLYLAFKLQSVDGTVVLFSDIRDDVRYLENELSVGTHRFRITIPPRLLAPKRYYLSVSSASRKSAKGFLVDDRQQICSFQLNDLQAYRGNNRPGFFSVQLDWETG